MEEYEREKGIGRSIVFGSVLISGRVLPRNEGLNLS